MGPRSAGGGGAARPGPGCLLARPGAAGGLRTAGACATMATVVATRELSVDELVQCQNLLLDSTMFHYLSRER